MIISIASPTHAQLGNLVGGLIGSVAKSSKMKKVCQNQQFSANYAGYMLGYHTFGTGAVKDVQFEKENALAQEVLNRSTIVTWEYAGWQGNDIEGTCSMHFALKLTPEDAAHTNNDPNWGGAVEMKLTNQGGGWTVTSFQDYGAKAQLRGWLAAWLNERDQQPGGAPRLANALSSAEQENKISYAQGCVSHWQVSDDLFPAYNNWLLTLGPTTHNLFKVDSMGSLANGRLVSSTDSEVVCRYDVHTGNMGGVNHDKSIHDIDFRFTMIEGRPKWEVVSFPFTDRELTQVQVDQIVSHMYIDGQPYKQWTAANSSKPAQPKPRNVIDGLANKQAAADKQAEDYARSQGVPVDEIRRAEDENTRKYAEPCRRNGGTWGRPTDKFGNQGRLGCYYPTGER